MKIIIMRHGEPNAPKLVQKINSKAFRECLEIYNSCGILDTSRPTDKTIDLFRDTQAIVASDLIRSLESASLFCSQNALIVDPLFREIEDSFISIPFLKLTPRAWGNVFILLWFCGAFETKSAFRKGKKRAKKCANKLAALAEEHEKVLFVGHGFINTYIGKELLKLGWDGPKIPSKRYWDYGVYQKNPT